MKLVWSRGFRDQLRREYEFIYERNPTAAESVVDRIYKASRRLGDFAQSGRSWRVPGTWELAIPGLPYMVIYRIKDESVEVLALFHTSREVPNVH
jgi:toxin ParE1/3/4